MTPSLMTALSDARLPLGQGLSLPPAVYTDPDIQALEGQRIFRDQWVCLGRADAVATPGTYLTLDVAGHALILIRDRAGVLHLHANTCRHRGARLLDGSGQCSGLRCPFHSWFYAPDGRLVQAPHMPTGFDTSAHGLISYAVAERAGFVFACLGAEPSGLDAQLGDFAERHTHWPLAELVTVRRRVLEVACNWKLFLDVFNEYYHLPFVHPDSIDSLYAAPDPGDATSGAYATQFGRTEGTGGLLETQQDQALPPMPGLSGRATSGARYTWVFPNLTFAANHDALWCYEAYPLTPDSCTVVQTACFHPETTALPDFDTRVVAYLDRLDAALDEDIPALVNQQRGMRSPDARPGPFQPDLEPNVAGFARWYAGVMLDSKTPEA